ncbi:hypothetical protein ACXET9_08095 [Brachybacterium sp. DNPG3]
MTLASPLTASPRPRIRDPLSPTRSPAWWMLVVIVLLLPLATAVKTASNSEVPGPLTLFSFGFLLPSALGPLLAALLYVAPFSGQVADGWLLYTRTRRSPRETLRRHALRSALIPAAVLTGGTLLLGVYAFVLGPFGLDGGRPGDAEVAMFTQLTAISTPLYVIVFALWQGLWAAVFSLMSFLILLLTGRRALALSLPLIGIFADNVAMEFSGNALLRAVSSIDPFSVVQAPIWTAAVPLLWWLAALAALAGLLRWRGQEIPVFR